jgi:hypothetical protein
MANTYIEQGIMLLLTLKGEKRYKVRVKDPRGKWYPTKNFHRLPDARAYKAGLIRQRDMNSQAPTHAIKTLLFQDFWELWREQCRHSISEGWKITERKNAELHIFPVLGKRKLLDIRPMDIGSLLTDMLKKGYTPQSVKHIYQQKFSMTRSTTSSC